jgi:hypothetical protein
VLGYNLNLDLTLLDIEDGIRRVALRKDHLILAIRRYGPAAVHGVQEDLPFGAILPQVERGENTLGV